MGRYVSRKQEIVGQVPGEPVFIGEKRVPFVTAELFDYNADSLTETALNDLKEFDSYEEPSRVTWVNFNGLHDTEKIRSIGEFFKIHPLVTEDIVNTGQRPKMEEYDDYLFFTLKMMQYKEIEEVIHSEQLSIVLKRTKLLTFQEQGIDVFDPVRNRIRKAKGRIRKSGTDYLGFALLDCIVDNYMVVIERLGEKIEELEPLVLSTPTQEVLNKIINYRREITYFRKTIQPVREFIFRLSRRDSPLIRQNTSPFIKDLLDMIQQTVEIADTYRDMLSDFLNIYNTGVSNKLNEIMKVLTIFSAIFIPLTFVAGLYGMNFENIPELHFKYSYFVVLAIMAVIVVAMLRFFKRKKWL